MAQNNREFLASDPKTIRWSVCKESQWNSFLFIFVFTESFLVRSVGSTLKLGSEKCFRIPGRKFQCILSLKCVFIREKVLIFGLLWRSDQGMEIGTLQYQYIPRTTTKFATWTQIEVSVHVSFVRKNKGYKTRNIYANSAIVDLSQKPFCKVIHILLNQKDHTYWQVQTAKHFASFWTLRLSELLCYFYI